MASVDITINGKRLSDMGVSLNRGGYAALMIPSPLKEWIENEDPRKNGTDVITHIDGKPACPMLKERDVTLTFFISGDDEADFLSKYTAFTELLYSGIIDLYVPDLNKTYHLLYSNSTQYDNYLMKACRLSVKFREPNPANRE